MNSFLAVIFCVFYSDDLIFCLFIHCHCCKRGQSNVGTSRGSLSSNIKVSISGVSVMATKYAYVKKNHCLMASQDDTIRSPSIQPNFGVSVALVKYGMYSPSLLTTHLLVCKIHASSFPTIYSCYQDNLKHQHQDLEKTDVNS